MRTIQKLRLLLGMALLVFIFGFITSRAVFVREGHGDNGRGNGYGHDDGRGHGNGGHGQEGHH